MHLICIVTFIIIVTIQNEKGRRMFVGRKQELATLERLYRSDAFQMPVVYGRRRVGKTSLIAEFVKGKPAIFFSARESTAKENLVALSQAIADLRLDGTPVASDTAAPVFANFEEAFTHVFTLAQQQRIVLVISPKATARSARFCSTSSIVTRRTAIFSSSCAARP